MGAHLPPRAGNPVADHHAQQLQLAAEHTRMVQAAARLELMVAQASKDHERRDLHRGG